MDEKRLIYADDLEKALEDTPIRIAAEKVKMFYLILNAPTVDAVEVVRCCDCHYCDVFQDAPDSEPMFMCMIHSFELVDPTDYCSRGERRSDGQ